MNDEVRGDGVIGVRRGRSGVTGMAFGAGAGAGGLVKDVRAPVGES